MSASHSAPSIPDTALGLTQGELHILRHQQEVMAQRSHQSAGGDRGRGNSRHSQPSSRAASAASSHAGHNRVVLDSRQLLALQTHLDNVMRAVENRINELEEATQASVNSNSDRHGRTAADAESQLQRMRRILAEIDALEADLKRITHIKDVVKRLRSRVDGTDSRLDRTTSSHHGDRHGSDRHRR